MINTKEIRIKMIQENVTFNDLAQAIHKKPVTVRHKILNRRPMFLDEADIIQNALKIPDEQFKFYFCHQESRSATKV